MPVFIHASEDDEIRIEKTGGPLYYYKIVIGGNVVFLPEKAASKLFSLIEKHGT